MLGRTDTERRGECVVCKGKRRDPRNRKLQCPGCLGTGKNLVCQSCGYDMPCPGTSDNILDQTFCSHRLTL